MLIRLRSAWQATVPTKPFIYIGALRRTGSTMLCEALTQLPHSIVFNEPNLTSRRFAVRAKEAELLRSVGVDLEAFVRRWSFLRRRFLLHAVRTRLVPEINRHIGQVGIKEIFHRDWRGVLRAFPNHRVVLTARDPRDIYLSLRGRYRAGAAIWVGAFTPEAVAGNLNSEFAHQRQMAESAPVLRVRYEDLCTQPEVIKSVLEFVESEIRDIGELGDFLRSDQRRVEEGRLHDGRITDKRVARWRQEDEQSIAEAQEVFDRMPEYCDYWSYSREIAG